MYVAFHIVIIVIIINIIRIRIHEFNQLLLIKYIVFLVRDVLKV